MVQICVIARRADHRWGRQVEKEQTKNHGRLPWALTTRISPYPRQTAAREVPL
jgi:hypothetical protein